MKNTNADLLRILLSREGVADAPKKMARSGEWVEAIFAIGDDETCHLTMTKDAYDLIFKYKIE